MTDLLKEKPAAEMEHLKTPPSVRSQTSTDEEDNPNDQRYTSRNDTHSESLTTIDNINNEYSISTLTNLLKEMKKRKKQRNSNSKHRRPNPYRCPPSTLQISPDALNKGSVNILIDPATLINEHVDEIRMRIEGHTKAALVFEKREKWIGYPVTILSSFLTSVIMMSISDDDEFDKKKIKYISLGLSVVSFLLSISREYFSFSKKFQSHDLSSKLYTTLLRSIESTLIKNGLDKNAKRDLFKEIVSQMSIIEQYETPIPRKIDEKVRDRFSVPKL